MTLEDLVPDLELCRLWKEKGGRQDTVLCWAWMYKEYGTRRYQTPTVYIRETIAEGTFENVIAAPTAGELMEWLPTHKTVDKMIGDLTVIKGDNGYGVTYLWYDHPIINWTENKKLPNALLKMALELKGGDPPER